MTHTDLVWQLDYERYNSRVDSARRKDTRSAREENALMKHEADLARTSAVSDRSIMRVQNVAYRCFRTTKLLMSNSEKCYPPS